MIKKKILIVDDDDVTLNFFKRLLSKNGYTVFSASNGREGLRMLNFMTVDLIMLDLIMPELSGLDFLKIIREREITDVPILMITESLDVDPRTHRNRISKAASVSRLTRRISMWSSP